MATTPSCTVQTALGIDASTVAGISESALAIAQGYTADLISGLTKDAAATLNAAIQRAFLGGQSVSDVIAILAAPTPTGYRAMPRVVHTRK